MNSVAAEQLAISVFDACEPLDREPRRVLHVINGEHYSGAERVQDLLALELPRFGYSVGFACLKLGRFADSRQARQSPLIDVSMRHRFDLRPARRLARLVKQHGYALIHTHTPRAAIIGRVAATLARVPLVHHVHSPTTADSTRKWQNRLNALGERASLTRVAAVVAVSESLGRYAERQWISRERIHVVPNGVPIHGPLSPRNAPRNQWTLGTVALFRPRKGLEVLLEALAMLRQRGLPVRLRAVGAFETPQYERTIHDTARRLGVADLVDWVGFTRDVVGELARLDLFVLPSLFGEGLPMVVLEAMAAGVPVVATDVEGVPEVLRYGLDGLLATAGDARDLARTINRVIEGPIDWAQLRHNAHRRQAERYSDAAMARAVADVYHKVLEL